MVYARSSRRSDRAVVRSDHGQAAVLVMSVVAVLLVAFVLAIAALGRTTIDRTRAQTAADAAALASVDGDARLAAELAARHGAEVVSWTQAGAEVTVIVRLGDVQAIARATNAP